MRVLCFFFFAIIGFGCGSLVGFYVSISCADRQIRFWWVSGFCGDRRRSTVSGLRVLLDFRKFH